MPVTTANSNNLTSPVNSTKANYGIFIGACLLFILVKIIYLIIGYSRELYMQGYEDLARFWFCYNFWGFDALHDGNPWLPLHPMLHGFFLFPRSHPYFMGSVFQTIISVAGGIMAGLIAMELCDRDQRAGVAALAAWLASGEMTTIGLGYLSEPLFQLEMLALIYFGLRWVKEGKKCFRMGVLLSIYAMELTRYEGWIYAGAFFALWIILVFLAKNFRLEKETIGNKESNLKTIVVFGVFIIIPPLCWIVVNWLVMGDPLYFVKITRKSLELNFHFSPSEKIGFFKNYLMGVLQCNLLIVIGGITTLFWFQLKKGTLALIWYAIIVVIISNYWLIQKNVTAFSYPERLSSNLYVFFCPLYGYFCFRLLSAFKKRGDVLQKLSGALLTFLLVVPIVMGFIDFTGRPSVMDRELGKNIVDTLVSELKNAPDKTRPRVLFETTGQTFSLILFLVAIEPEEIVWFNLHAKDSPKDLLARNKSILFLVLNNKGRGEWMKGIQGIRRIARGPTLDLYSYQP